MATYKMGRVKAFALMEWLGVRGIEFTSWRSKLDGEYYVVADLPEDSRLETARRS